MSKHFWIFLILGLAVTSGLVWLLLFSTQSAHLELTGSILKVRVLAMGKASLVVVDFRATNPSGVPFVLKTAEIRLDPRVGEPVVASTISKVDMDNVFKYQKLIGPKYNDALGMRDRIPAGQTLDRMVAARIELPESDVNRRKAIHLRLEDLDGAMSEIDEKK